MRIPRFYCPLQMQTGDEVQLPTEAHRHAVQVLRLKQGAELILFNGSGMDYHAQLERVDKRQSVAKIGDVIQVNNESPLSITLLQGISRGEKMDFTLQKAVELGVHKIIPIMTDRSNVQLLGQRADKKRAHWQGVMISACEQSGRSLLPELGPITPFDEAIEQATGCRVLLEPTADNSFSTLPAQSEVQLLIGAEGGFSESELNKAVDSGFQTVRFGPRVLRTETAGLAALAVLQSLWGDMA